MNTNIIYSRSQQKIDTEANWLKAVNFTPLKGEIIIYSKDENFDYDRIKIGDGETKVTDLAFTTEHLASKSYVAENTLKEIKTGVGLTVSEKENNSQQINIDENVIFVFDCGGADITNYEPITTVTNDAGGDTAII